MTFRFLTLEFEMTVRDTDRRSAGRVPRIASLMALALRFEQLLHSVAVRDYAELARLARVSRARITQ